MTRKVYRNHMHPENINGLLVQQLFNCARNATRCLQEDFPEVEQMELRWLPKSFFTSRCLAEVF